MTLREIEYYEKNVIKGDGCWGWKACKDKNGYALIVLTNYRMRAHRFSYILHKGAITEGLFVLHKCDNPPCTNPDHLWVGSNTENMHDMQRKGRKKWHVGEEAEGSKLTNDEVQNIRRLYLTKLAIPKIATIYNVNETTIRGIIKNKYWKSLSWNPNSLIALKP